MAKIGYISCISIQLIHKIYRQSLLSKEMVTSPCDANTNDLAFVKCILKYGTPFYLQDVVEIISVYFMKLTSTP